MGPKWMLKSCAGNKILQILEKTTVDFVSGASSIYHYFFFLGPLWWCQMLTPSDLRQPVGDFQGIYCLWLSPSVVNLVTLHSAVRLKHHRVGQNSSWCLGYCFPSGCCCLEKSGVPEQGGWCSMCDDSAVGFWGLLFQFSPQSLHPQCLLRGLYPALPLPLLEPSVSGLKWKFVCWPF